MSIEQIVNQLVDTATSSARTLAEAQARQSERIRAIPAQTAKLLEAAGLVGAADRLKPSIGITIAALEEHRKTLAAVIAELEQLAGAAS